VGYNDFDFFDKLSLTDLEMDVNGIQRHISKYIFGFFESFHPCLALKLAKYKKKIPYGNHETQILMMSSNPLKKCNKIHPKSYRPKSCAHRIKVSNTRIN
jgi:hypothetical protein